MNDVVVIYLLPIMWQDHTVASDHTVSNFHMMGEEGELLY